MVQGAVSRHQPHAITSSRMDPTAVPDLLAPVQYTLVEEPSALLPSCKLE